MSTHTITGEQITFRQSHIHGSGGFAATDMPTGTRLIEYRGERIDKAEADRRCEDGNPFVFHLNEEIDLDGNVEWNPARLLNHSCVPNCEADCDGKNIWIVALRDLAAGEELTFNYGYELVDYRDSPCLCGTTTCVGYIVAEEYFEQVRLETTVRA
ncbi:MAG: SET domain-containing protein-lysine N-methyltransferase [Pedosphaera sp.]|nr:SET domain-containing protein [Pedosphaera sp.]PHX95343.1 MAG: SET domain-containing protein-lysine N-methyltransferase [Pedosphaera sp.]